MAKTYKIGEICGDWALQVKEPVGPHKFLYFKSKNNAELVKSILEWEDAHPNEAVPYKPTLTPPNEPEHVGLYGKYTVYKNKDGSLVTDCFILRPAKDPAAVAALRAYAAATDNAELAADIINWVGAEPNEPLTLEQLREMDGEPVWVVVSQNWRESGIKSGWRLVKFHINDDRIRLYMFDTHFGASFFAEQDMGLSYWVYRRPPEGEA